MYRPGGIGKTTTLVARAAWLIATGVEPGSICAITFNKRAAIEMTERLDAAVAPLGVEPGTVRVRTFHALGREILSDAGEAVEPLADRQSILADVAPWADAAERLRLDTVVSRLKVELGVTATQVAADPEAGPSARAFVAYEAAVLASGGLDFDDLILRAIGALERDPTLLARWRSRSTELLVDEVQDVDRAQLGLALLLAAPANRIFLVGDDDQSIYGWRLADVRRILGLAGQLPGLRRVDLEVNYRCPRAGRRAGRPAGRAQRRTVPEADPGRTGGGWSAGPCARCVRRDGPLGPGGPDVAGRRLVARRSWPGPTANCCRPSPWRWSSACRSAHRRSTCRSNPRSWTGCSIGPQRSPSPANRSWSRLDASERRRLRRTRVKASVDATDGGDAFAADLLAWSAGLPDLAAVRVAITAARDRLAFLRRDDAALTLATAHSTKGLEFDHVIVVGMEAGRFPSARAVSQAEDPTRAYEEERRLAYVAWTRARRSLTLLYDPAVPSPFLLEAFTAAELGLDATMTG